MKKMCWDLKRDTANTLIYVDKISENNYHFHSRGPTLSDSNIDYLMLHSMTIDLNDENSILLLILLCFHPTTTHTPHLILRG